MFRQFKSHSQMPHEVAKMAQTMMSKTRHTACRVCTTCILDPCRAITHTKILLRTAKIIHFHFSKFRYCLTFFPKSFSHFPHGTCVLSISNLSSFADEHIPPHLHFTSKKHYSGGHAVHESLCMVHRSITFRAALFPRDLHAHFHWHCTFTAQF